MESITTPILKQIEATNTQYDIAVEALVSGEPSYMKEIHKLCAEANKLFGLVKQVFAQLESNIESESQTQKTIQDSISAALTGNANIPTKGVVVFSMAPVIAADTIGKTSYAFYVKEFANIAKLIKETIKLIDNITSLAPIISFLMEQITKLQKLVTAEVVKMKRKLLRQFERIQKNKEWLSTELSIRQEELYSKTILDFYTNMYYSEPNQKAKEIIQEAIDKETKMLEVYIPNKISDLESDKEYWKEIWEFEDSEDA